MDAQELESYRRFAGVAVGGVPLLIALVAGYVPVWRRGFATERTDEVRGTWYGGMVGLAVVLIAVGLAGFMLHLQATEGAALLEEPFWTGLRDGAIIVGVVLGVLMIILLWVLRKIVMVVRGKTPYSPFEKLGSGELRGRFKEERNALRERLEAGVPGGPAREQAVACLEAADTITKELAPRAVAYTGGWPDHFVAVVLCRVARMVLDTGVPVDGNVPFCWLNPLHGPATAVYGQEARPRPLCGGCLEELGADPQREVHPLHVPHRDGGWQPYLLGVYFEERRGLDHVFRRVREKQRARA
ncbi:hypothetical protein [Actinomadura rugatobispora]|uniref:Uncharacterized protein n=1 Tax=Actinomadura rugatobispora TaxID=1994 RepID=A0ABW0ZUM4_9ACTN|nr:hypothetical protein GCM10010200_017220 [Actinomadura rugatobispora]